MARLLGFAWLVVAWLRGCWDPAAALSQSTYECNMDMENKIDDIKLLAFTDPFNGLVHNLELLDYVERFLYVSKSVNSNYCTCIYTPYNTPYLLVPMLIRLQLLVFHQNYQQLHNSSQFNLQRQTRPDLSRCYCSPSHFSSFIRPAKLRNAEFENRNLHTQETQHSPRVMGSSPQLHETS